MKDQNQTKAELEAKRKELKELDDRAYSYAWDKEIEREQLSPDSCGGDFAYHVLFDRPMTWSLAACLAAWKQEFLDGESETNQN